MPPSATKDLPEGEPLLPLPGLLNPSFTTLLNPSRLNPSSRSLIASTHTPPAERDQIHFFNCLDLYHTSPDPPYSVKDLHEGEPFRLVADHEHPCAGGVPRTPHLHLKKNVDAFVKESVNEAFWLPIKNFHALVVCLPRLASSAEISPLRRGQPFVTLAAPCHVSRVPSSQYRGTSLKKTVPPPRTTIGP